MFKMLAKMCSKSDSNNVVHILCGSSTRVAHKIVYIYDKQGAER